MHFQKINSIALSSNDNKKIQSIDSIETYVYGTSKDLMSEKLVIKCSNIINSLFNLISQQTRY